MKDKIRERREQVKSLDLKKENIKDKIKMQESFIEELESRGNANINTNKEKITNLDSEVGIYMSENASIEENIHKFTKEQEEVLGAGDKLVKLKPLSIKELRKFMIAIKKTGESQTEDETLNILIDACAIALEKQLPDLVADREA